MGGRRALCSPQALWVASALLAISLCSVSCARAASEILTNQGFWFKASYSDANDEFGWSVAVQGDLALVSARNEASCGKGIFNISSTSLKSNLCPETGIVYIMERDQSTRLWNHVYFAKPPFARGITFGASVGLSGNYAVIGASKERSCSTGVMLPDDLAQTNTGCTNAGAAYILERDASTGLWKYVHYVKAPNTNPNVEAFFGYKVAISGDYIAIASDDASCGTGVMTTTSPTLSGTACPASGAVFVLQRDASSGMWTYASAIKSPFVGSYDYFGEGISMSGDRIAIGGSGESSCADGVLSADDASLNDDSCPNSGAAYFVKRNATTSVFEFEAVVKALNTDTEDYFAWRLSLDGDRAVIGSSGEGSCGKGMLPVNSSFLSDNTCNETGAAFILEYNVSTEEWAYASYIKAPHADKFDWFGTSVVINGDHILVGATGEDSCAAGIDDKSPDYTSNNCPNSGAVYLLTRSNISGRWEHEAYIKAPNTHNYAAFSWSGIALDGNVGFVSIPWDDSCGTTVTGIGTLSTAIKPGSCVRTDNGAVLMIGAVDPPVVTTGAAQTTAAGITTGIGKVSTAVATTGIAAIGATAEAQTTTTSGSTATAGLSISTSAVATSTATTITGGSDSATTTTGLSSLTDSIATTTATGSSLVSSVPPCRMNLMILALSVFMTAMSSCTLV